MSFRPAAALLPTALLALAACAPTQRFALECVPREVVVYVDGRALEELPEELELRSDEPHTVFFKGPGYRPELVVLESGETPDGPRLAPEDLCAETRFVGVDRELQLDVEE